MNFTREPIIETIITAREGNKLHVRNTKTQAEDYFVEALEVVSFGNALFFRSQERPKAFLVPVTDYEVVEAKEARMMLKNSETAQPIKIGSHPEDAALADSRPAPERQEQGQGQGRNRRRRRGRDRHRDRPQQQQSIPQEDLPQDVEEEAPALASTEQPPAKAPSFISKLFPPPQTLIKDSISRYKAAEDLDEPPTREDAFETPEETEDDNEE